MPTAFGEPLKDIQTWKIVTEKVGVAVHARSSTVEDVKGLGIAIAEIMNVNSSRS